METEALHGVVTRGGRVESVHPVLVAVTDAAGRTVAFANNPAHPTYFRSAAKPLQAWAAVSSGAADRFALSEPALALACASHSGEPAHVQLARQMLSAIGADEGALACGGHLSLEEAVREAQIRERVPLGPVTNNCSGKHAAMLALARHLDAPLAGYEDPTHPAQRRVIEQVARACGLSPSAVPLAGDGCTAPTFYLPLAAMARGWAVWGTSPNAAAARLRAAMWRHPFYVGGTGRACTAFLSAAPGGLLAKIGAEGVYCAALPRVGLGVALKVHSGEMRFAALLLATVLSQIADRWPDALTAAERDEIEKRKEKEVLDTRGRTVGQLLARGALRFA